MRRARDTIRVEDETLAPSLIYLRPKPPPARRLKVQIGKRIYSFFACGATKHTPHVTSTLPTLVSYFTNNNLYIFVPCHLNLSLDKSLGKNMTCMV